MPAVIIEYLAERLWLQIEDGEQVDAQLDVLTRKMRHREDEKEKFRSRIRMAQRVLDTSQEDVQDQIQRMAQEKVWTSLLSRSSTQSDCHGSGRSPRRVAKHTKTWNSSASNAKEAPPPLGS